MGKRAASSCTCDRLASMCGCCRFNGKTKRNHLAGKVLPQNELVDEEAGETGVEFGIDQVEEFDGPGIATGSVKPEWESAG